MLYCDLSTYNCNIKQFEERLSKFANAYVRVNNSLWFFNADAEFSDARDYNLPVPKYVVDYLFQDYEGDDSSICCSILDSGCSHYCIPDEHFKIIQLWEEQV